MKKSYLLVLSAVIFLLIWGVSTADEYPINPRRSHVLESIEYRESKNAGLRREGLYLAASEPTITVKCNVQPSLTSTGKFTVTVENDDGSDWRYEYGISDLERDAGGYIFYSNLSEDNVFNGIEMYTSGTYRLYVTLYRHVRENDTDTYEKVAQTFSEPYFVPDDSSHPTLEEKAREIVAQCKVQGDDWQTALNIHDWLTQHTYYDQSYEYYGADVIFRGKGVCDSYSKAYELLCDKAGITAPRVSSKSMNHAWNVIRLDGQWYQTDVTWDDPSGELKAVSGQEHYAYFCLSDEVMFLDHIQSDVTYNPGCSSMAMNYYIKKNQWEQFGKYNYSGNTVIDFFREQLNAKKTEIEFSMDDWRFYWPGGNAGFGMGKGARYGIYVAGMKQSSWEIENLGKIKADIELCWNESYVSLKISGWDIPETGTLTLPAGTKAIDEYAFEGIRSTTVVIPKGCTQIKAGAFKKSGVRVVQVLGALDAFQGDPFEGCGNIIFKVSTANESLSSYAENAGHLVVSQ